MGFAARTAWRAGPIRGSRRGRWGMDWQCVWRGLVLRESGMLCLFEWWIGGLELTQDGRSSGARSSGAVAVIRRGWVVLLGSGTRRS